MKELGDVKAMAQQTEEELKEELEKERMNLGRKDRDMQVCLCFSLRIYMTEKRKKIFFKS